MQSSSQIVATNKPTSNLWQAGCLVTNQQCQSIEMTYTVSSGTLNSTIPYHTEGTFLLSYCWYIDTFLCEFKIIPSLLWGCWLGDRKDIRPVKRYYYAAAGCDLTSVTLCSQDTARPDTMVLVGRLSAHLRCKLQTTIVRHVYICRATDQNLTDHLLLPDHRYGTVCQQICA